MKIKLEKVSSSQIHAIGYHPESKTLAVQFHKREGKANHPGATYHYHNVSPEAWQKFQGAPSKYSHFHREIKPAYTYAKQ